MYVEDMIHRMAGSGTFLFQPPLNLFARDLAMATSFSNQISQGSAFTEKQATIALRFCQKYKSQLEAALGQDLTQAISNPKFQYPLRTIAEQRRNVSLVNENPKKIKVTFNYDENLVKLIREHKAKNNGNTAEWDMEAKAWMFNLTEGNILFVKQHLISQGFNAEPEILEFIEKIDEILVNFEQYVPMVVLEDNKLSFKNVHSNVPPIETENLLDALFTARKYGVRTWDETLENYLENDVCPLTQSFLKARPGKILSVDSSEIDITQFRDIVRHAGNVVVIIPANNETVLVKKWHNFLLSEGFLAEEMAVLFRLENSNNKEFNDYVKDNQLNLPLNSKTKIFFISQKMPKPLIRSKTEFGAVINLGNANAAHYSIQNLLNDNPDVIMYK